VDRERAIGRDFPVDVGLGDLVRTEAPRGPSSRNSSGSPATIRRRRAASSAVASATLPASPPEQNAAHHPAGQCARLVDLLAYATDVAHDRPSRAAGKRAASTVARGASGSHTTARREAPPQYAVAGAGTVPSASTTSTIAGRRASEPRHAQGEARAASPRRNTRAAAWWGLDAELVARGRPSRRRPRRDRERTAGPTFARRGPRTDGLRCRVVAHATAPLRPTVSSSSRRFASAPAIAT
jgi:hypothetical protein